METRVILPDSESPQTIKQVVTALRSAKLKPTHQQKDWGDWIVLDASKTVISIESTRGLTTSATIESTDDEWEINLKILKVFNKLAWMGEDEDGPYPL